VHSGQGDSGLHLTQHPAQRARAPGRAHDAGQQAAALASEIKAAAPDARIKHVEIPRLRRHGDYGDGPAERRPVVGQVGDHALGAAIFQRVNVDQ